MIAEEEIKEEAKSQTDNSKKPDIEDTPKSEPVDELDEMLDQYAKNKAENQDEQPTPDEPEPETTDPKEDQPKTTEEESEFTQPEEDEQTFDGINIADFISAELLLTYYEDFMITLLHLVHKISGTKKPFKEEEIRVGEKLKKLSAKVLDMYWQTVHIKIHPALAAGLIMSFAMVKNYRTSLKNAEDEPETTQQNRTKKNTHNGNRGKMLDEFAEDVEFEDVPKSEAA